MAVSGNRNFIQTRDQIKAAALRKVNALAQGEPMNEAQSMEAGQALDIMVQSWQNEDIYLWTIQTDIIPIVANTIVYSLSLDVIGIENVIFRHNGSDIALNPITREEYSNIPTKTTAGDPNQYYIDYQLANPFLYLWPVSINTTAIKTGTDANKYLCIQDHTSSNDNKPITGSSYLTNWELTTKTASAWASGQDYRSDVIQFSKILRLQDFTSSNSNPDFPVKFYLSLVYGLAVELAPEYGITDREYVILTQKAEIEKQKAKNTNSESADLQLIIR